MSLASFHAHEGAMTWLGVGNVEGILSRADPQASRRAESLLLLGGVAAGKLPPLHASTTPVARGDTLIFATDGIEGGFAQDLTMDVEPQKMADRTIARYGKKTEDALVLVARYLGCRP